MSHQTADFTDATRPTAEVEAGPWSRKAMWTVLAVALVVRVVWLLNVNTMPVTDFYWYFERAVGIASGEGYSVDGTATAYWPVGYPAFLSVFFRALSPTITFAKLRNLLLVLGSIGLTFRLAHRLFHSNAVAVVSALLLSFHLNWIAYTGVLASEPLYAFLTLWGTWVLLTGGNDKGRWTIGGLLFGLAALVRPQAVLLPAIVLWCTSRYDGDVTAPLRLRSAMRAAYFMVALALIPWAARNVAVFRAPVVVTTNMGDNLLIGNNPDATGGYMNPELLGVDFSGMSEPERDSASRKAAVDHIVSHPWRTVRLWPAKLMNTFGRATDGPYWGFMKVAGQLTVPGAGEDKAQYLAARSYSAWYHGSLMLLFLVAVPGLALMRRRFGRSLRYPVTGLAMVGYIALLSMAFFGNPRFAFPVMPFVSMYAAALLVVAWQSLVPIKDQSPEDDHWGSGI